MAGAASSGSWDLGLRAVAVSVYSDRMPCSAVAFSIVSLSAHPFCGRGWAGYPEEVVLGGLPGRAAGWVTIGRPVHGLRKGVRP